MPSLKASLLLFFVPFTVSFVWTNHAAMNVSPEERLIRSMPAAELCVSEYAFDIISVASVQEDGNVLLNLFTNGSLGQDTKRKVLYRGTVLVRYGVDLQSLSSSDIVVGESQVLVHLPEPEVLGKPEIARDSRVLDVHPEETEKSLGT